MSNFKNNNKNSNHDNSIQTLLMMSSTSFWNSQSFMKFHEELLPVSIFHRKKNDTCKTNCHKQKYQTKNHNMSSTLGSDKKCSRAKMVKKKFRRNTKILKFIFVHYSNRSIICSNRLSVCSLIKPLDQKNRYFNLNTEPMIRLDKCFIIFSSNP